MASRCGYFDSPCWFTAPVGASAFQMMGRPLSRAIRAAVSSAPVICVVPRPSSRSTREKAMISRSGIMSVTIGVPSKSRWTLYISPEICELHPHPPASIASTTSWHICSSSSSLARISLALSMPMTYWYSGASGTSDITFTPFGIRSMLSRNSGNVSQSQGMPARIVFSGTASLRDRLSIARSWSSSRQGAKPKPQLPMTTLVTPCQPDIVHHGSQKIWLS